MREVAEASDLLADATGSSAERVANAEAARQLLRRGIDDYHDRRQTGRWLVRKGTEIAALGAVFGAVFAVTVAPGLWPAVVGFVTVTGIFAALWAGILALEGELL